MAIRPLDDRVVIKIMEAEERTSGGIILPDSAKEKPQRGKVVSAGNGKLQDNGERVPLELQKGDIVIFGKYSGSDIKIGGQDYKIMRESEVLARIKG